MGIVYSLYDALVSINVPDEKAKAVIDALEREMMDKLATKADIEHLRATTTAEFSHLKEITSKDMASLSTALGLQMKAGFSDLRHVMLVRMAQIAAGSVTVIVGLIAVIERFVA
jgi:hypothetical protein